MHCGGGLPSFRFRRVVKDGLRDFPCGNLGGATSNDPPSGGLHCSGYAEQQGRIRKPRVRGCYGTLDPLTLTLRIVRILAEAERIRKG